jgi:alpha-tubulin suppressor-like RCC1 family protein
MVIAARGAGEQPQPGGPYGSWNNPAAYTVLDPKSAPPTFYGVGEFNYNVYTKLKDADSHLQISLDPVRYPADPAFPEAVIHTKTFQASVDAGAYSIVTEIARTRATCGDHVRFLLAGYSEGAWSVHRALYALQAQQDGSLGLISAVVLFGDPEFVPGQVIDQGSQTGLINFGIATPIDLSHTNVPDTLRPTTASYCLPGDLVCQGFSPAAGWSPAAAFFLYCKKVNWAPDKCPHTEYLTSGATAHAAAFVLPLLPTASVPGPAPGEGGGGAGTGSGTTLSAGFNYTCAIQNDHTLWCWGGNWIGQLGTGDTVGRLTPTQVGTTTNWATVSAGGNHSCATRTDGTLWCWGANGEGELGTGDTASQLTPTQVGTAADWATVSTGAGSDQTCATRTDHTLWCWGWNPHGELGTGDTTNRLIPTQVGTAVNWTTVSAGYLHTCAISTDHTLWCWGHNSIGELGTGDTTNRLIPTQVETATNWATVSTGMYDTSTCATRTDGTLWCWGDNSAGELGTGDTTIRLTPTQVGTATNWATVSASGHTCALRTDHTLWCWGDNYYGELGTGYNTSPLTPGQVGTAMNWATVSTGSEHTCAMRTDGTLWCWGDNYLGELGTGDTLNRGTPTQVG